MTKSTIRSFLPLAAAVVVFAFGTGPRLHAQSVLFSDSFNRADHTDIDASTNGMSGVLMTNGTFGLSNVWLEPVDVANAEPTDARVLTNALKLGGNGRTVHVTPNRNLADELSAGTLSLRVKLLTTPTSSDPTNRYAGVGVGGSLTEFSSTVDQAIPNNADLFVAETQNGLIRINDGAPPGGSGTVTPSVVLDLDAGSTAFVPGVLRVDLTITNTTAGSTVIYDVFFDSGGGFVDVLPGTRSFVWSGNHEVYTAIAGRSQAGVVVDDFQISGTTTAPPAPQVSLSVSPTTVYSTNSAQAVTLTWTTANLTANSTYAITANQPVTFPGGGQGGAATNGTNSISTVVNGTLGNTMFTISISNAVPQWVASATATVVQVPPPPANPPNVVVILWDDTGWADFSCYGGFIQTPNVDSLATNGLRFREFYQTARCSTTRCSILTGLYTHQVAVDPAQALPNLRTDNNVTIAELLGANGYRSYMSGKWHIGGAASGRDPRSRGFDHAFGFGADADGSNTTDPFGYWLPGLYDITSTGNAIPKRTYTNQFHFSDAIGDYSVDFLNHNFVTNSDGKPFFLYMPFNAPHWPVNGPAALANKYTDVGDPTPGDVDIVRFEDGWDVLRPLVHSNQLAKGVIDSRFALSPKSVVPSGGGSINDWNTLTAAQRNDLARRMAVYAAMIEQVDQNIGKVITRLKQLNQFDNTIIFIVTDNGANYEGGEFGNSDSASFTPWAAADLPSMGQPQNANNTGYPRLNQGGAWANLSNTPFRLFKHHCHNGGIRTPMILHWPDGMTNSIKGTWTEERGHLIDIMATIVAATGIHYPTTNELFEGHAVLPLEGTSLLPTLAGNSLPARDLGFEHESNRAFYRGNWKLVTKSFAFADGTSPADELELYDMSVDPTELTNRAPTELNKLAEMVNAWNAWASRVGVPPGRLLSPITPPSPQTNPPPLTTDLFIDTFNRTNSFDADGSAAGMFGALVPPFGQSAAYYEGYEGSGTADSIQVNGQALQLATGFGMSESGLMHNFTGQDIANAGGFSVQLRVDLIDSSVDTDRYAGFGVGLSQSDAMSGNDHSSPGSFRGSASNPGVADFFLELDALGNVKAWNAGALVATVPVGQANGTLLASFALNGFSTSNMVTVSAFFNGQLLDLDAGGPGVTQTFNWSKNGTNFIGLSARASNLVRVDNLAIRKLPLAYTLATEYAIAAGLNSPTNAPTANPDGDADNNMVEWLKGGNPGASDPERRLFWAKASSTGEFRFGHYRLTNAALLGVNYSFRYSTDLMNWTPFTPEEVSSTPDSPGYALIESRVPTVIAAGTTNLFILMEAAAP